VSRFVAGLATAVVTLVGGTAPASAHAITSGVITVGVGAAGVELGMTRGQVIAAAGQPLYENHFGYMQYTRDSSMKIFGVYRDGTGHSGRVHLLIIAAPGSADFKLADGNEVFTRGGLRRVAQHYGNRLRFHNDRDNGPYYEIVSHREGMRILTDFTVGSHSLSSRVHDVSILYSLG
jgi:hypothetical protein